MSSEALGSLIDSLGVHHHPQDGELVETALVILCAIDAEGRQFVRTAWPDGMSWITRRGLLEVALDSERIPPRDNEDDDDD